MIKLTQSLETWLFDNHPSIFAAVLFGHTEVFTPEMEAEYLKWCQTDEGKRYLKGGDLYKETRADESQT